ncbi:MAG: hypothetical protein WAN65_03795 [Candidatus Sulfotelmatobacter sp.]
MSDRVERRTRDRSKSGEHPVVRQYRAKLESVDAGATAATTKLDLALQEFLTDLKTPVPPRP